MPLVKLRFGAKEMAGPPDYCLVSSWLKMQNLVEGPVFAITTPFTEITAESGDGGEYRQFRVDEQGLVQSLQFLASKVTTARLTLEYFSEINF